MSYFVARTRMGPANKDDDDDDDRRTRAKKWSVICRFFVVFFFFVGWLLPLADCAIQRYYRIYYVTKKFGVDGNVINHGISIFPV